MVAGGLRGRMDELGISLIITGASVAAALFCGWRGSRLWDIRKGPRLMPWRFLMLMLFAVAMFAAAHVMTLVGLKPAQRFP